MAQQLSLIEFIRELLFNHQLQQQFQQNPQHALASVGLSGVDAQDVKDALTLVHEDGPRHGDDHHDNGHDWNKGRDHDDHRPAPEPHPHETAAQYVNRYITNNFVDHRETNVDNSLHQNVDTHGGDFDQDLDFHPVSATGAGAVAAGHDISGSTITSGDGNQVGQGNVRGDGNVVGDHNQAATGAHDTVAFGHGNATSTDIGGNVTVGAGGAFNTGSGTTTVDNSDSSLHDVGNQYTDNSAHGSFNNESDNSLHNVGNTHEDLSQHDSNNTHDTVDIDKSFNQTEDASQHIELHH